MNEREGFTKSERNMMLLSHETREGLKLTGVTLIISFYAVVYQLTSFVELVQYLFTMPGVSLFLSNRICQDPLENFFGQQRQRGRTHENPSSAKFIKSTQALRVISNTCGTIRGNCRGGAVISEDYITSWVVS